MNKFISVLFLLVLVSCSPVEVREDSRISIQNIEGYHKVIFDCGPRVSDVRLEGVIIDVDQEYYIEEGEYLLTYEYNPKFTFGMELSYKTDDRDRGDGGSDSIIGRSDVREKIIIAEDKVIKLEGKTVEVNFTGEVGI